MVRIYSVHGIAKNISGTTVMVSGIAGSGCGFTG
jgi:hypothetical protein